VPTDGGHLLSGQWSFGSGLLHSGFIHSLGVVEGTGEPRIFVTPVDRATLIHNWDVMGLRATGSIDYTMDNVFVPEHFSHFAVTETPERGGNLYRLGIINIAGICHSGQVRIRLFGDDGAARGRRPALLPRHARGHAARDPVDAHPADRRPQGRRPGGGQEVAVPRPGRLAT
jgi:hypothetical protein